MGCGASKEAGVVDADRYRKRRHRQPSRHARDGDAVGGTRASPPENKDASSQTDSNADEGGTSSGGGTPIAAWAEERVDGEVAGRTSRQSPRPRQPIGLPGDRRLTVSSAVESTGPLSPCTSLATPSSAWARYIIRGSTAGMDILQDAPFGRSADLQFTTMLTAQKLRSAVGGGEDPGLPEYRPEPSMRSGAAEDFGASVTTTEHHRPPDTGSISMFSGSGSVNSQALLRRQQRLEQSLERRRSDGQLGDEPSRLAEQIKQSAIVAKARLLHGITSEVDQYKAIIEREAKKSLIIPLDRLHRICEWADLVIEAMLDIKPLECSATVGGTNTESKAPRHDTNASDTNSATGSYSLLSDEVLVPLTLPGGEPASPAHANLVQFPVSRHSSSLSAADPPGAVWDDATQTPGTASLAAKSKALTQTIRVLDYEVTLTTAALVPVDVAAPATLADSVTSPRASHSPQSSHLQRGSSNNLAAGAGVGANRSRTLHPSSTGPQAGRFQVDEVDQLIFGTEAKLK